MQRKRDSPSFQPFTSFQPVFITFKLFHLLKKTLECSKPKIFRYKQQLPCFWSVCKHWKAFSAQHADPKKFVLVFGYMFKHKPTSS